MNIRYHPRKSNKMLSPVKLWRSQKHQKQILGKTGKIVSFTIVRLPPLKFSDQAPYAVVLVDFGKFKFIGQLVDTDFDKVTIGQKVVAIVRRVRSPDPEGVIPYGIKFKLIPKFPITNFKYPISNTK